MEKINIAEILKDCPEGMELDCTLYEKPVKLMWVSPTTYLYPINIQTPGGRISLTEYGCYTTNEHAKCVIFPKGKTTWEEGLGLFKDGDILVSKSGSIFMFKEPENISLYGCYFALTFDKTIMRNNSDHFCTKDGCRFATEEEKKELFNILQTKGYKWNSETKTLEKLIPKFKVGDRIVKKNGICVPIWITGIGDGVYYSKTKSSIGILSISEQDEWELAPDKLERLIKPKFKVGDMIQDKDAFKVRITEVNLQNELYMYESLLSQWIGYICFDEENNWELVAKTCKIITLKPYDRVLVRFSSRDIWRINLFEYYNETLDNPFLCMGHQSFKQCIPYEGNEHLLGTSKDCFEYYHRIEKK